MGKEELIKEIRKCYDDMCPMDKGLHDLSMELYRQYLCIGGMPNAINNYIKEKDVNSFNFNIQESIITAYLSDMTKYTNYKSETFKINAIYNKMPAQLAKENKKFNYKIVETNSNKRELKGALEWLISSGMLYECDCISTPQLPLMAYIEESSFKLYMNDVGLLTNLSNLPIKNIIFDSDFIFKGALAENYVVQELTSNGIKLFYWKSTSIAEVDFIIQNEDGIIPIEVKANDNFNSKSLSSYIKRYSPKYGIRISAKNFGYANNIKSIPLYATFVLLK